MQEAGRSTGVEASAKTLLCSLPADFSRLGTVDRGCSFSSAMTSSWCDLTTPFPQLLNRDANEAVMAL